MCCTIAVVGGGAGGVELSFAISHRLKEDLVLKQVDPSLVQVVLLNKGSQLLRGHNKSVRRIVARLMEERGIQCHCDADICSTASVGSQQYLVAADGRRFAYDEAVWCTEGVAAPWLKESGLECDAFGCVKVKATLESVNVPGVFASGDVCSNQAHPRSKAGVFAVRAGPPLVSNIRRLLFKEPLEEWVPQTEFLGIISVGGGYAVASKGGLGVEGAYLWTAKDRIDRGWMDGYGALLPTMEQMQERRKNNVPGAGSQLPGAGRYVGDSMGRDTLEMLSRAAMRCGGCGSKVGSQLLSRALKKVRGMMYTGRSEVVAGVGFQAGDDAALVVPPAPPAYLVHTIDYFRSFVSDPYVFGQIAANHALSDVHAMNGEPVSALALCVVPYGPEDKVESYLVQMLAGALKTLSLEKCALVGGHTSEGAEPALGLSVNGVVHPDRVLRKGPLSLGHALLLTKGLGTGTIMAADMRGRAKGRWVSAAIDSMLQSNGPAASILHKHGCSACTDVTGFGLLGHLIEMIQFSEEEQQESGACVPLAAVDLCLSAMPLLTGAAECVEMGIMSSLHPQNIRCAHAVSNAALGASVSAYPLLFDPQTSGGLLASIPKENIPSLLAALHAAGFTDACVVGEVVPRESVEFAPLVNLVL